MSRPEEEPMLAIASAALAESIPIPLAISPPVPISPPFLLVSDPPPPKSEPACWLSPPAKSCAKETSRRRIRIQIRHPNPIGSNPFHRTIASRQSDLRAGPLDSCLSGSPFVCINSPRSRGFSPPLGKFGGIRLVRSIR